MYTRQRRRLFAVLAFGFTLFFFSSYLVVSHGDGALGLEDDGGGRQMGVAGDSRRQDMFTNDHIDVPEIPIAGRKVLNDSDYETLYRLGKSRVRSRLSWHNNIKPVALSEPKTSENNKMFNSGEVDIIKKTSDQELERFKDYFNQWPEAKPKAAFYVLTSASRLKDLRTMLKTVDSSFNDQFHYPVIIFHEASFSKLIPMVRRFTNSSLFFQLVVFRIPDFLREPVKFDIPCMSSIGYRHMCRFNAKSVYEEATIRALDYYWRLDDDSKLLSPVRYDVFRFMRARDLHYGYSWIFYDAESCVTGLWEATHRYVRENPDLRPTFFKQWRKPQLYYNNFEISSTRLWLSREYRDYIEYLDKLGGIYYFRWGDAPIHGIAVSLFLQKNATHWFNDIGYQHNSYIRQPGAETPALL